MLLGQPGKQLGLCPSASQLATLISSKHAVTQEPRPPPTVPPKFKRENSVDREDRNWSCLVCAMLENSNTLTANYSIKQSQFTKPIPELPR